MTTLIYLLIYIATVGVVFYLVENLLPMAAPFRMMFRVMAMLFLVLLILSMLGYTHVPLPWR